MSGPVLFKVDPIPHETLMSLAVRVANKNVLPSWHKLLRQAGAKHSNSPTAAANANLDQNQVADIFRLPVEEVAKRCVAETPLPKFFNYFDRFIRADEIDHRKRRFSPAALSRSRHLRAMWSLKMVPCCTETWQYLVDTCECGTVQKWRGTFRLDRCNRCNRRLDLLEGTPVEKELREDLSLVLGLIDPDDETNKTAMSQLPTPLSDWNGGLAFELALLLLKIVPDPYHLKRGYQPTVTDRKAYTKALSQVANLLRDWPHSLPRAIEQAVVRRSSNKSTSGYTGISGYLPNLESELVPDNVKTEIFSALAPLSADAGSMPAGQVAMTEAVSVLGMDIGMLAKARRNGLLKTRVNFKAGHFFPALDSAEVTIVRDFRRGRTSAEAASRKLGLPQYAMALLYDEGLIFFETHPYMVKLYGPLQLHATELARFIDDLHAKAVPADKIENPVNLHRLARSLGGGFKPWGHIFHRMMKGGMQFSMQVEKTRCISISARDAAHFLSLDLKEIKPSILPEKCSQRDAVEILNLPLKHVQSLDCQPEPNGKWLMDWTTILDLARRKITLTEMVARCGIHAKPLEAQLKHAGYPRYDDFGGLREDGLKALSLI